MAQYIVGVTGGIGSGKSEVTRRFEAFGIDVVDADIVAREVVVPGSEGLQKIVERFSDEILLPDATLNRARLRELIFNNEDHKCWLEALLHPIINRSIRHQLTEAKSPYAILVSPLLLETRQHELVHRILVIDAPESIQIARASQRDNTSEIQIRKIIDSQITRAERCNRANDIIQNHGDLTLLDRQVSELHALYLTLAQQFNADENSLIK